MCSRDSSKVRNRRYATTSFLLPNHSVLDHIFQATQDIALNQKVIAANEGVVKACEDELIVLREVEAGTSHWWGSRRAVVSRQEYLLKKMRTAVENIEALEKQNAQLKKTLSKVAF